MTKKSGWTWKKTEKQDGKIVAILKKKYTLHKLLANTNPSDYGGEIDWGDPVGNEEC